MVNIWHLGMGLPSLLSNTFFNHLGLKMIFIKKSSRLYAQSPNDRQLRTVTQILSSVTKQPSPAHAPIPPIGVISKDNTTTAAPSRKARTR
ncbi:hypothetical protein AVEN_120336-1 [Araneus ventricosus]|uniref:Uncharacterized protein n=1 Tax=Araneus ventricosus TaxID=182803 RepID=A0A4Y2KMW1_ARAVE|nr:hypothetical protein AVEN_120336-1 [Araneus ventricosus]